MQDSSADHALPSDFPDVEPRGGVAGKDPVAFWLLVSALLLGLVRFVRLGDWSLWMDEALTLTDAQRIADGDLHNPLGYGLVVGFAKLFSDYPSEALLRLLPAIVGWFGVPLCYWAFRPLLSRRSAAAAAVLLALSPWALFWSQSARFYTLAQAASMLGTGCFVRGLWRGHGWRWVALGILIAFASALFHISGALVAGGLLLSAVVVRLLVPVRPSGFDQALLRGAVPAALLILCLTPWALSWLQHHLGQKPDADIIHFYLTVGYFFGPSLLAGSVCGAWIAASEREAGQIFVLSVPLVVLGLLSLVGTQALVSAQYAYCVFPFTCALAAAALDTKTVTQATRYMWLLILALPLAAGDMLYLTSRGGERPRWREAWEYVASQREPGDLVIGMGSELGEHYLGGREPDLRTPRTSFPMSSFYTNGPRLWRRHSRSVWVVVRPLWFDELGAKEKVVIQRWLGEDCRLMRRFPVEMEGRDLDLEVWKRD
ncbi:MAG: glycosyltransferase family 39 protein [Planctomycetes bacterium]|nr:glycosyltransferase family 39 protein [Planctomycetota bacterium]